MLADNGARHVEVGPMLGAARDADVDGSPSLLADGDGADDDGVIPTGLRAGNAEATVTVLVSGAPASGAKLDGWIDLNADGAWGGPGEQVFASAVVVNGVNHLTFAVPSWAATGATFARFRLSTAGALGPKGEAADGEVEDYQVTIAPPGDGDGQFAAEADLPVGVNAAARAPAVVDLDRDGDMDLLVAKSTTLLWYENSNGSFATHTIASGLSSSAAIFACDIDGDSDIDILYPNGTQLIWLRNNGQQTFTGATLLTSSFGPAPTTAADVDGDGDVDLIGGGTTWYANSGSETFTVHNLVALTGQLGTINTFTPVDLDSDGDLDFLAGGNQGAGWFEMAAGGVYLQFHQIALTSLRSLVPVDLDGDGDQDFVAAAGAAVQWFQNDGDQDFSPITLDPTAASLSTFVFTVADVDGDGDGDLLSNRTGVATWHENDGSESFTAHPLAATGTVQTIAAIDVDGDSLLDIVAGSVTGNKVVWRRQLAATDFGDAPAPYPTTPGEAGARHLAIGPQLGATRTAEPDGVHGSNAADDDGVMFGALRVGDAGATAVVHVENAPQGARVSAWIDFNGDGNWGGAGEQIVDDAAVANGDNLLQFTIPAGAKPGPTHARVRISTSGGLGYVGAAADGEVEDYAVSLEAPAQSNGVFGPGQTTTGFGYWLMPVDLDRDGDMDMVGGGSTSPVGSRGTWLENDGHGGLTSHSLVPGGTSANVPYIFFHASDLDGDGDVDLMADGGTTGKTIFWYENDGHQAFAAHATAANAGHQPLFFIDPVTGVDLDGDGAMDVVGIGDNGIWNWFRNTGDQSFTTTAINSTQNRSYISFASVDFDQDGDLDFLTSFNLLSTTQIRLRWIENLGGVFQERQPLIPFLTSSQTKFDTVVAGDLDADGDIDLVVQGLNYLVLVENRGGQNFVARQLDVLGRGASTSFDYNGMGVRIADMDGDGDLDVVAARQGTTGVGDVPSGSFGVSWFENRGGLAFNKRTLVAPTQGSIHTMFIADVNGDGTLDLLAGTTLGLKVYPNLPLAAADYGDAPAPYPVLKSENGPAHGPGGPTLGPLATADAGGAHSPGADGDASDDGVTFGVMRVGQLDATITLNVQNAPAGARVDAWIDFNGDGTWAQADEQILGRAVVVEGDNEFHFVVPSTAAQGTTYARVRISTAGGLTVKSLAADGEVEDYAVEITPPAEAASTYGGFVYAWAGDGYLRIADLDGDGDLDEASLDQFKTRLGWRQYLGDGAIFHHLVGLRTPQSGQFVDLRPADVDRDGDMDLAYATTGEVGWYENNGAESFRLRTVANGMPGSTDFRSLQMADIDGDGYLDFVVIRLVPSALGITAYINSGSQTFLPRVLVTPTSQYATALAATTAVDVDGDGDVDIAAAFDVPGDSVKWYENDGHANFTERAGAAIRSRSLVAADLDSDGDVDLIAGLGLGTPAAGVVWLDNDGHGGFTLKTVGPANTTPTGRPAADRIAAGDADGDGDVDVVVADSNQVWLFRNDGSESFAKELVGEDLTRSFSAVALGDLNGDGDLEILTEDAAGAGGWFEPLAIGETPIPPNIAADYGSETEPINRTIDGFDLLAWQQTLGDTLPSVFVYRTDWNRNQTVDGSDLEVWKGQFGQGVVLDHDWAIQSLPSGPPSAEAATAVAMSAADQAAQIASRDARFAAGDFTSLFSQTRSASRGFRPTRRS